MKEKLFLVGVRIRDSENEYWRHHFIKAEDPDDATVKAYYEMTDVYIEAGQEIEHDGDYFIFPNDYRYFSIETAAEISSLDEVVRHLGEF